MSREPMVTDKLRKLIAQLLSLTENGELRWEREVNSAHRYARWRNNLLILGPADPLTESDVPRYLFITPFDSPACVEISSTDEELGQEVLSLVNAAEAASEGEAPTDPFSLTDEVLGRFKS